MSEIDRRGAVAPAKRAAGTLEQTVRAAEEAFQARHGRPPQWIVAAPGRVNLIGEHVDYNDGFVLPMAIERYVVVAAGPCGSSAGPCGSSAGPCETAARPCESLSASESSASGATFHSLNLDQTATISLDPPPRQPSGGWVRYVEGVVAGFDERIGRLPAFDAVIHSTVPLGGGLSSSAALEVAVCTLLEAVTGVTLDPVEKALLCQQAEHRFAGVPCGIMVQFSSVFGREDELMLLDCRSQAIRRVPLADRALCVLIANSNVRHELSGGEYAARRGQCQAALAKLGRSSWRDVTWADVEAAGERLTAVERRRARHVVSEIARTVLAADAIAAGDWRAVGEAMYASHDSLRDDYEVSCSELDLLVELARELGRDSAVIGARMTGGGFGGCTVNLVRAAAATDIQQALAERYEQATGIRPELFLTRPARGAHRVRG